MVFSPERQWRGFEAHAFELGPHVASGSQTSESASGPGWSLCHLLTPHSTEQWLLHSNSAPCQMGTQSPEKWNSLSKDTQLMLGSKGETWVPWPEDCRCMASHQAVSLPPRPHVFKAVLILCAEAFNWIVLEASAVRHRKATRAHVPGSHPLIEA